MTPDVIPAQALGAAAALASAFFWALTSVLFGNLGEDAPPEGLNLAKCLAGTAMLGAAALAAGFEPPGCRALLFLGLSGAAGIAAGDTFYFRALVHLGPRLTVLLSSLAPAATALAAAVFLGERPSAAAWAGIFAVSAGAALAAPEAPPPGKLRDRARGLRFAMLSVACMAAAVVLAKIGLAESEALGSSALRMAAAGAALAAAGAARGRLGAWLRPLARPELLGRFAVAAALTMFGGFYLSLLSLKLLPASAAAALGSTVTLFIVPLSAVMLKERVTARSALAAALTAAGAALILS